MDIRNIGVNFQVTGAGAVNSAMAPATISSDPTVSDSCTISASTGETEKKSKTKSKQIDAESQPSEQKKANPEDYHFKPPFKVYKEGNRWMMELPNAKVPCPQRPVWLDRIDKLNALLDESHDPPALKKHADTVKSIADKSYNAEQIVFNRTKLESYLGGIDDRRMIHDLDRIFKAFLEDETQSTYQVGGAMAGARCSEMHKYGNILECIDNRKKQL